MGHIPVEVIREGIGLETGYSGSGSSWLFQPSRKISRQNFHYAMTASSQILTNFQFSYNSALHQQDSC
jgi:hypothetical protein